MKKFLALVAALFFATAAHAQNAGTVANHAYAIGKGPNVAGYTSLLCASGQLAIGSATDPTCRTVSGDATLSAAGVVTLATVNGSPGAFGSNTATPTLTVNAKGLVTAINSATITPAVGSVTGLGTGAATALGVNVGTAGAFVVNGGALGTPSSGVGTNLTALNASNLGSGTVPAARLPTPTVSTLGGVQSLTCAANQWLNTVSTLGVPSCAQPAFTNLSGSLAQAQVPAGGSSGQVLSTDGAGTGSYVSTKAALGGASINTITQGTTGFFTNNACSAASTACQIPVPYAGTVKRCTYASNGAPPAGQTFTLTLLKNGAATTNTAQITSATPLVNGSAVVSDATHTVAFAASDLYVIQVVATATAGTTNFSFGCEYDAP